MKRPRNIWLAFAGCSAVVLAAMAWISFTTLRLERDQADADRRAVVQEKIRLALWRMESALPTVSSYGNFPSLRQEGRTMPLRQSSKGRL